MFGGRVGITDHVDIADDVQVMATSLVSHTISRPGVYSSVMPLDENRNWRRNAARFKSLDRIARRLRDLERKIESLLQGGKP
jgi:UDP-3-O-[3-hydroxymyristoyl] glucosamine N-acyltransferase